MNHTDNWMNGWMGGGMWLWTVIGVVVVARGLGVPPSMPVTSPTFVLHRRYADAVGRGKDYRPLLGGRTRHACESAVWSPMRRVRVHVVDGRSGCQREDQYRQEREHA